MASAKRVLGIDEEIENRADHCEPYANWQGPQPAVLPKLNLFGRRDRLPVSDYDARRKALSVSFQP